MSYMCMDCGEIYDWHMEMCPKVNCQGEVVWIDELMLPTIRMLRNKGYITEYCCSGHVYEDIIQSYVCLDSFVTDVIKDEEMEYLRNNLPKAWIMKIDERFNRIMFEHICKNTESDLKKYEDILKANLEFLRFVDGLPELEY